MRSSVSEYYNWALMSPFFKPLKNISLSCFNVGGMDRMMIGFFYEWFLGKRRDDMQLLVDDIEEGIVAIRSDCPSYKPIGKHILNAEMMILVFLSEILQHSCLKMDLVYLLAPVLYSLADHILLAVLSGYMRLQSVIVAHKFIFDSVCFYPLSIDVFKDNQIKIVSVGDSSSAQVYQIVVIMGQSWKDIRFLIITHQESYLRLQLDLLGCILCFLLVFISLFLGEGQRGAIDADRAIEAMQKSFPEVLLLVGMKYECRACIIGKGRIRRDQLFTRLYSKNLSILFVPYEYAHFFNVIIGLPQIMLIRQFSLSSVEITFRYLLFDLSNVNPPCKIFIRDCLPKDIILKQLLMFLFSQYTIERI